MDVSRLLTPFAFLSLPLMFLLSCSPARQDMVVANVGEQDITLGEYEYLFAKTSSNRDAPEESTIEEREQFLDLVTKFKLKLADAYSMGMDRNPDVVSEVNLYKGSLATSYLIDREVLSPGVEELYRQRQTEYRASHILLDYPQNGTAADSAAAYEKAHELIARIATGENFTELALEHSIDPSVDQNKGDLYYFAAGQMVRPFENAVMAMKVGEVSSPVRTDFGLHIIKLNDKIPASGEIRCSHLMVRFPAANPSPEDTSAAYEKIRPFLDSLSAGGDFARLARKYSEDPGSAGAGGDLGWFGRRRWVSEFDEEAFKLSPGQTSGIVRSRYGYHIIYCADARPPKPFDEAREDLKSLYEQARFDGDRAAYVESLKKETAFRLNESTLSRFMGEVDTLQSMKSVAWDDSISAATRMEPLMYFGEMAITVDSTVNMLRRRPDLNNTSLRPGPFREAIDKVIEQSVFLVKAEMLEREDKEFARLMREYTDGILLYQIEQEKVWNSISVTDSALVAHFEANRDQFTYPDRVEYVEVRGASREIVNSFLEQIENGTTFAELAAHDSARMQRENNLKLSFRRNSTKISRETLATIKMVAEDLNEDSRLRLHIVAHPDTAKGNKRNPGIATERVDTIKDLLISEYGVNDARIQTFQRPIRPQFPADQEGAQQRDKLNRQIDLDIVGRRKAIVAEIDTFLVPVDHDNLSKAADKLEIGSVSGPINFKNGVSIIRLIRKEAARQKTFEEAGTEVSSAFQEYESNRLQDEWLEDLAVRYPVTKNQEVLESAFVVPE